MADFNNILNFLLPNNLMHTVFELADRRYRQHILGFVFTALCMLGIHAHMGQAGIGTIDQAQVSNYRPVPPHAVIAQPQMLFLFLNHHLNRPTLQIKANDFRHRQTQIVRNQCDYCFIISAFGKDDFNCAQFIHRSHTLSKFIVGCFFKPLDAVPSARSVKNISAVFTNFMFDRINGKPAIRLADANITPFPLLAGIDDSRAKIERIKQHGDIEFLRYVGVENNLPRQFRQFPKRLLKALGVFFFDVQPRAQRDRYSPVEQTGFENRMAHTIFTRSMVMNLADCLHIPGSLDRLRIIDNQQAVFTTFLIEPLENSIRLLFHDRRRIKFASPEKLAVIGAVSCISQELDQPANRAAVADTNGQDEIAIIRIDVSRYLVVDRFEKRFDFLRNFADSNHKASLPVNIGFHSVYRLERLFLLDHSIHKIRYHRSV